MAYSVPDTFVSAQNRAAALGDLLVATQSKRITSSLDIELATKRLLEARRSSDSSMIVRIAELAASWNVEEMTGALRETARDPATPGDGVDAALAAIVASSSPSAGDTRNQFVRDDIPSVLRLRFARAVAKVSPPQAAQSIANAIRSGIDAQDGEQLVRAAAAVLSDKSGVQQLTSNLKDIKPDADAAKLLLRALFAANVTSGPLVEKLSASAGLGDATEPMTDDQRKALVKRIDAQGDPHRGQAIYRRKELNCIQCHAISGAGGNVGPDMSGVGVTSPTEYLLESILAPSAVIKEAYLTLQVLTSDGVVVRGVKVDRDDQRLILRDENGREIVIPEDEIEQESEGKSLMPEGLHHLLTQDELVDLVAFLSALGKPGDFVVNSRPTVNRYSVLANEKWINDLIAMPEGKLEGELTKIPADAWQSAYALVDGTLPADSIPQMAKLIVLRGEVDIVVAGKIGVQATSQTNAQVVINGKSINGNGKEWVELPVGKHAIHVVIEDSSKLESVVTEITKSADSEVQFTIVGGV